MTPAGVKMALCKRFEWDPRQSARIEWFDTRGVRELSNTLCLATIDLDDRLTPGSYFGFRVRIVNKITGVIDEKFFKFDDYLPNSMEHRLDNRATYGTKTDHAGGTCFYIDRDFDWYIARPKTTRPLCEAIEAYVRAFE